MDAKPHRPVRAFAAAGSNDENVIPYDAVAIYQDKSSGNGQKMTVGFRGPAKRTAFADVSNTAGTMAPQDAKALSKNYTAKPTTTVQANKENAGHGNETFLRPAQRLPLGNKPLPSQASQASVSASNSILEVPLGEPQSLLSVKPPVLRKSASIYNDTHDHKSHSFFPAASLQPQKPLLSRNHKSQPYLRAEAPVLRRTQSKNLDRVEEVAILEDDLTEVLYEDAVEDFNQVEGDHRGVDVLEPEAVLSRPIEVPERENMSAFESDTKASKALPPVPSLAEYEEYWDDEDEEDLYDEQGYTTAHSYRSHGDNTTGGATAVLAPKVTVKIQRELEEARMVVESSLTQDDFEEDMWDVSMVAEYGDEIFEYMKELEIKMLPPAHYMDIQSEIQWSMRSVLMDWLVQVHNRFALLPETLFLTVNYIDRFLALKIVSLGKLQLVGATAIFVAAKYEEINCPSVQEIVFMVDSGYTVDEILKAERYMLSMLQFELGWPGPMSFLRRISKADDYDLETRTLAKYFLEVTIMDERFVGSPPSYLAAGAHCLARLMLKKGDWSHAHIYYSGYTWSQLKPLVSMILECCQSPQKHHASVYEKYSDRKFKRASQFVEDEMAKGFTLPSQHPMSALAPAGIMEDDSALMRYPPLDTTNSLIPIEG